MAYDSFCETGQGRTTTSLTYSPDARKANSKTVILVHGLGLHKCAFEEFAKSLASDGYTVKTIDIKGFGGWLSGTSQKESGIDFYTSAEQILRIAADSKRSLQRVYLIGESVGGALCLEVVASSNNLFDGLVLVGVTKRLAAEPRLYPIVLKNLITDRYKTITLGSDFLRLATDDKSIDNYWSSGGTVRNDYSALDLWSVHQLDSKLLDYARRVNSVPTVVIHSQNDHFALASGSNEVFNNLKVKDKELFFVMNPDHVILEKAKPNLKALQYIEEWLDNH